MIKTFFAYVSILAIAAVISVTQGCATKEDCCATAVNAMGREAECTQALYQLDTKCGQYVQQLLQALEQVTKEYEQYKRTHPEI